MSKFKNSIILPSILGSNMVFQQNRPIKLWGNTEAQADINIKMFRKTDELLVREGSCTPSLDGDFQVELQAMEASLDKYDIRISGEDTVLIEDVMVGEVWLSAGQSNMQLNLQYIVDGTTLMEQASNPNIRIFYQDHIPAEDGKVDAEFSYNPVFDVYNGYWRKADSSENVACCSGIGYVFALEIYEKLKAKGKEAPVAIINSATGSSSIHSWIGRYKIEESAEVKEFLASRDRLKTRDEWNKAKEWNFNQVSALYNHKIAPLINLEIKGVLWYQGENDVGEEENQRYYKAALKALIEQWGEEKIFLLTQLAPFEYDCSQRALPGMRDCLVELQKELPNTTAVIPIHDIDLIWEYGTFGYKHPIHPLTKIPVGKRMALAAMALAYGEGKECNLAPICESAEVEENKVILKFNNVGSGLRIKEGDSELKGFVVEYAGDTSCEAKVRIAGADKVEVLYDNAAILANISYGYIPMNNSANLTSSTGIPALPFNKALNK